ncbi:restriction endonuclease subunit S [Gallibacterium anatis]|uniref:restriction endonuclease subunit S n=1 Tax=Gallibacterium anatis TaxID=750 RepID=UPI003007DBB0
MSFNIKELINIPMEWTTIRVGDIAKINAQSITKKDTLNTIQYIDISSVSTHKMEAPKTLSFSEAPSRAKRKLKNNDFIISTVRPNLKQFTFITKEDANLICSTGFCVISAKDENIAWYLYAFLTSDIFTNYLVKIADGGAYPAFNSSEIENAIIPFPPEKELIKISNWYKTLFFKITLNTQTNQTLEQIAQGIFKHWFIDFAPVHAKANALARGETIEQAELAAMACLSGKTAEKITALKTQDPTAYHQLQQTAAAFPSEFVETEMGEVPKGWGYKRAEDLFKIGIGKTPPRKESQWFSSNSKNNVEWISIKDMGNSGTHILNSSEYLTQEAIKNFNIKKIPENTVLLSFKLTIGRVSITTKETTTNEAIAHFKIGKSHLSTEFLYCYLKNFDFEQLGSTSSIATAVNSKTIKNMNILFPDIEVVNAFQKKISILFEKIKSNTKEISYLTSIRDELLPKLLNGEVEL